MFLLSLPWGIDSAVVGCCLVACMLLVFAPGVAFVLLACLPIPLTGLKSSLLNEKGRCMLFATGFMSPCVTSSPWVAPEWLKLSCVSKYKNGYYRSMIFHHLSTMIMVYIHKSCIWILSFKVGYGITCNVIICIAQVIFTYHVFLHVFRHMIRFIIFSL